MLKETTMVKESASRLQTAFETGEGVKEAFAAFGEAIAAQVQEEFEDARGDQTILMQRGFRTLTAQETEFYEKVIEAGKSGKPIQEITGLLESEVMPTTVIEDVYRELTTEHPLLSKINFVSAQYLTRWIVNDATVDSAVWGEVNDEITKEITGGLKTMEITQCKLSAFAMIEKDMLDLGPVFLDNYIRTFLKEALLKALEKAIVSGSGKSCPIGLDRNISKDAAVVDGAYPQKEAIAVKTFLPEEYGKLLSNLAVTEKGNPRTFDKVLMICNMSDYLTKVMPATTVMTANGGYANNLFPFPTEVIKSNELETGKAVICLPEEYFMGVGTSKEGAIEYSDEFKFLEDKRVFKIKMHGMGKAYDNTVAIVVDISALDPAYITVLNKQAATA